MPVTLSAFSRLLTGAYFQGDIMRKFQKKPAVAAFTIVFCSLIAVAVILARHQGKSSAAAPLTSSQSTAEGHDESLLPNIPATAAAPTKFVDATTAAGLTYRWHAPGKEPRTILDSIGNGCAFLDYNNDGNLDILFVGPKLALYAGDGRGHFTDVTRQTCLDKLSGHFLGCAVGDYDNDGFDDVIITGFNIGLLLHNEHGKRFRDVTASCGIDTGAWCMSAAWADVDNDGKLDLYICHYVKFGPKEQQLCPYNNVRAGCGPVWYEPQYGVLYHNDGNGKFTDSTQAWGMDQVGAKSLGAAFADFNHSGRQSLYVAKDLMPGNLCVNVGGSFQENGRASGTAVHENGAPYAGMGVDWGDYDNDGRLDLAVMAYQEEDKGIFHNQGDGVFTNEYENLGFKPGGYPWISFGTKWLDYDNGGYLDLIYCNGHVNDNINKIIKTQQFGEPTMLYHNNGGESFDNVSMGLVGPADRRIVGRGLAIGDYDNDGRIDALVVDSNGLPLLLHNETPKVGHWLSVRLIGKRSNRDGFGAMVKAVSGTFQQLRLCQSDGSYLSASDRRVHIGVGKSTKVDYLTVQWPSGHEDNYRDIAVDRPITIVEGSPRVQ